MDILSFIEELNHTDGYIRYIYSRGGCYKFHVLLSKMYKNATPYINEVKNHVITRYRGKYYDIYGEVTNQDGYKKLTDMDIPMVSKWSFRDHNLLVLTECPNCDEPIMFEGDEI